MERAVDDVIGICADEGVDADILKSGVLYVARSPAQLVRMQEGLADDARWGIGESHQRELDAGETAARVGFQGALGGVFSPHAARVQPAKLVAGIAKAVERRGVRILEGTRVSRIDSGLGDIRPRCGAGTVVLRCLEGYTASIHGQRRTWLPMNSAMIVTEPLPDDVWGAIGWNGSEVMGDCANAYCYAQRTADGRIALGGRGIPYRFGSRTDVDGRTQDWTIDSLTQTLRMLFPATSDSRIEHAWCGVLGVPRDWCASVTFDPATGLGSAGGYVGSGLTTTFLAGRTLADLALGRDSISSPCPGSAGRCVAGSPSRCAGWAYERCTGLYRSADRREDTGLARPARWRASATG